MHITCFVKDSSLTLHFQSTVSEKKNYINHKLKKKELNKTRHKIKRILRCKNKAVDSQIIDL